jgi:hypothetical protein
MGACSRRAFRSASSALNSILLIFPLVVLGSDDTN